MNKKILGLALTAIFTTGTAQAILIDDFNDSNANIPFVGLIAEVESTTAGANPTTVAIEGSKTNNVSTYAPAFGGGRSVDLDIDDSQFGLGSYAAVGIDSGSTKFDHNNDSGIDATSRITWLDVAGVDLMDGLINNFFNLEIASIDQGQVDFTLAVTDLSSATDSVSFSALSLGIGVSQTIDIAFASFAIDFLTVQQVSLQMVTAGTGGVDFSINNFETSGAQNIPEPANLALLSIGMAAFGYRRRKAKK